MYKIRELKNKAVCITNTMIIYIGKDIQQKILSENNCQFSHNWFRCFRNLYELNRRKMVGEAYSNNFPAVVEFTEYFRVNCNHFDSHDIYNADETAFYIKQQTDKSYVIGNQTDAPKKDSSKLTVLFACNAMGHKLAPVFICKSAHPRCFKNFDWNEEGIIYPSNTASWMSVDIFNEWLEIVNKHRREENRVILIIVDNTPVHKLLRKFTHVFVLYLPPRTSTLIQPLDMGMIW